MLQIQQGEITGYSITGNVGNDFYDRLLPLSDDNGVSLWVLDSAGESFTDSDGQIYTLRKRTPAEIDDLTLPAARERALTAWNQQVNMFITQYFDTGTQISFVKIYIQSEAARPLIEQVDAWVSAVMAHYYTVKAALQVVTSTEGLNELQASMEFDSRFGVQGSVLAVPDVKLSQFF